MPGHLYCCGKIIKVVRLVCYNNNNWFLLIRKEVKVMKYAFIANIAGVTPETYSTVFETSESYNLIAGVDGMDAAREYVKKLVEDGFELIDLCGDFDDVITAEMQEMAGPDVEINHADYTKDELVKLNHLDTFRDYGVIIMAEEIDKPHEAVLRSDACDMRVIFVKDMRQAKNAAKRLIEKRVNFIELCSWFDILRLMPIVEVTENRVPVGTCGELKAANIK